MTDYSFYSDTEIFSELKRNRETKNISLDINNLENGYLNIQQIRFWRNETFLYSSIFNENRNIVQCTSQLKILKL